MIPPYVCDIFQRRSDSIINKAHKSAIATFIFHITYISSINTAHDIASILADTARQGNEKE